MDWMTLYRNVIICGDFNLHINNPSDKEAQSFMDTMEVLGLKQHVSFQNHHISNILDLIFTEMISQFNIRTFKGRFMSDHRVIVAELNIRIQHNTGRLITFRNLKKINVEEFGSILDLGYTENMKDLELMNNTYERIIKGARPTCARKDQTYYQKREEAMVWWWYSKS